MRIISKRAWRPGCRGRRVLVLALTAVLVPSGVAPRADEPKPGPSPALQDTPVSSGGASAGQDNQALSAAPEGKTGRSVFGTIMGCVLDVGKKPLAGWMVQLSSRGEDGLLRVTGTNEKGQYVFKDLPAGTYEIEVAAGNEAARKKGRIEVKPPFRNIVDFEIGPQKDGKPDAVAESASPTRTKVEDAGDSLKPVPIRGIFVDPQKRPVSEVSVTIVALEGKAVFQAFSGDDGSFAIDAVPPGRYRVLVVSPGYVSIDLKSVEVSRVSGLSLSLSLVDHPLNTKERPEGRLPREEPLPVPPAAPTSQPS